MSTTLSTTPRPDAPTSTDVVVVGAGLAGLMAATHAATAGARVAVLESTNRHGGRARTDVRNSVSFNQGPHALYESGAGMAALRELGIDPPGRAPSIAGSAIRNGRIGRLPFDAGSLLTTKLLTPGARVAFARFHGQLARLDARSFDSTTVAEFLDRRLGNDRADLRALVEGLVRLALYSNAPHLLSAGAAIDQLVLARSGVRYLDHGWGSLAASIAAAARRAGATIHTDTSVRSVEPDDGGWLVVDRLGRRWPTQTVVIAGLSPEAAAELVGDTSGRLRTAAGPPVRAACLDLVLPEPPAVTFALDLDHDGYLSMHAPVADLAPDGRALVSLAHYRRPGEATDVHRDREQLRTFARKMGVEATLDERYLHDMTVAHGTPLAARGGRSGRPDIDALGRPGLLLAGDWVGSTGLLADAALASSRAAGRRAAVIARERCAA
jgi:predicted NAD/FAD-dependent oxidoreductase